MATMYTLKMGEELEYANQALPSTSLTQVVCDMRNGLCYSCGAVGEDGEMVWVVGEQGASPGGPASPALRHNVIDGLAK